MHFIMRYRNILYLFLLLILSLSASSCNDWLEATSSSQVSDKKLFSTRSGFKEALTGIYLAMGTEDVYGANYTWRFNDIVCLPYATLAGKAQRAFQQNEFSLADAMPYIDAMWRGGYHVVACANKLLYELEQHRDIITDDLEYNLIKGEALAARAYVHFDLMRMFGEASWQGENADKQTIPYVRSYSSAVEPQRTYSQTAELLIEDIMAALKCLEKDPVRGDIPDNFNATINADAYWSDRQKHLNYYAVKALLARVYLWQDNFAQAYSTAYEVATQAQASQLVRWLDAEAWAQESEADHKDWTFSVEHIFSLEVTNLYESLKESFYPGQTTQNGYVLSAENIESLFRNVPEYGIQELIEDVRGPAGTMYYRNGGYIINKFYSSNSYDYALRARMPMIRLSEMYLIMAQAMAMTFDYAGAGNCLNQIRMHRGLSLSDDQFPATGGVSTLNDIMGEYLKETIGEGRFLFAYRNLWRLERDHFHNIVVSVPVNTTPDKMKYPYPLEEVSYGRVQDE